MASAQVATHGPPSILHTSLPLLPLLWRRAIEGRGVRLSGQLTHTHLTLSLCVEQALDYTFVWVVVLFVSFLRATIIYSAGHTPSWAIP